MQFPANYRNGFFDTLPAPVDSLTELSLLSVFLVGLLGGAHCALMCGPIVTVLQASGGAALRRNGGASTASTVSVPLTAVSQVAAGRPFRPRRQLEMSLAYNLGRISMYTFLGMLAGALGAGAWLFDRWLPVQQLVLVISSFALIMLGFYLLRIPFVVNSVERVGGLLWRYVQPHAQRRLRADSAAGAYVAGGLWGLLPCGMVYGVAMVALASGSAATGALLMLVFGLGTLPNLLLLGYCGDRLATKLRGPVSSRIAGFSIAAFGVIALLRLSVPASALAPIAR